MMACIESLGALSDPGGDASPGGRPCSPVLSRLHERYHRPRSPTWVLRDRRKNQGGEKTSMRVAAGPGKGATLAVPLPDHVVSRPCRHPSHSSWIVVWSMWNRSRSTVFSPA
jgi:hypothetical protein